MQERQECQYGENCTFAYCQEEIDVWTQERKGALSRELLFDPLGSTERRALSVTRLLQLHMGMFMFLCEVGGPVLSDAQSSAAAGTSASSPVPAGMLRQQASHHQQAQQGEPGRLLQPDGPTPLRRQQVSDLVWFFYHLLCDDPERSVCPP